MFARDCELWRLQERAGVPEAIELNTPSSLPGRKHRSSQASDAEVGNADERREADGLGECTRDRQAHTQQTSLNDPRVLGWDRLLCRQPTLPKGEKRLSPRAPVLAPVQPNS